MAVELRKELDRIETKMFNIELIDHWSIADKENYNKLQRERTNIINKLRELEK